MIKSISLLRLKCQPRASAVTSVANVGLCWKRISVDRTALWPAQCSKSLIMWIEEWKYQNTLVIVVVGSGWWCVQRSHLFSSCHLHASNSLRKAEVGPKCCDHCTHNNMNCLLLTITWIFSSLLSVVLLHCGNVMRALKQSVQWTLI